MKPGTIMMFLSKGNQRRDSHGRYMNYDHDYDITYSNHRYDEDPMNYETSRRPRRSSMTYDDVYDEDMRYERGRKSYTYPNKMTGVRYDDYMPWDDYHMPRIGFAAPHDYKSENTTGGSKTNNIYMYPHQRHHDIEKLDKETAKKWVEEMEHSDGTYGQHWTIDQTKSVQEKTNLGNYDPVEFYVAMNMMYSDYCKVAKKYNVDAPEFYAYLSDAFLKDKDAQPEKLARYYEYISEH